MSHRGRTICLFASVQISSVLLTRAIHLLWELRVWVSCLRNKERGRSKHTRTINKASEMQIKAVKQRRLNPISDVASFFFFFFGIVKASLQSRVRKLCSEMTRRVLKAITHTQMLSFSLKNRHPIPTYNFTEAAEFNRHVPLRLRRES